MIETPIWDTGEWPGLAAVEEALRLGQTVVGIDDRRKARAIDLVVCRS
ncbi:MAG: hypothetical protein O7C01_10405 [Actinobacteria bacterium]|nr:hypothetical protein [Actinomycetota bacterium]